MTAPRPPSGKAPPLAGAAAASDPNPPPCASAGSEFEFSARGALDGGSAGSSDAIATATLVCIVVDSRRLGECQARTEKGGLALRAPRSALRAPGGAQGANRVIEVG
jgi:hypothetical protein